MPDQNVRMYNPTHRYGGTRGTGPQSDVTVAWRSQTDGRVESTMAVVDGTVYVGSCDNNVYALDAADGTERWRFKTDSWVQSSPVVVDGTVYVGSHDGNIYALAEVDPGQRDVRHPASPGSVADDDPDRSRSTDMNVFTGDPDYSSTTDTNVYHGCPGFGTDLTEHGDPNFCPECGRKQ